MNEDNKTNNHYLNKYPKSKKTLKQITHELGERVKELNCLYSISKIFEKHYFSPQEALKEIVKIIPYAWQYPASTCCCIKIFNEKYFTPNFKITRWKQSQDIFVAGEKAGMLQVCYFSKKPDKDEGPFLKEERNLIIVIAKRIGDIIEKQKATEALQESQAQNMAILDALPDFMFQVSIDGRLLGFHPGKFQDALIFLKDLIGKNPFDYLRKNKIIPSSVLKQTIKCIKEVIALSMPMVFEQKIILKNKEYFFEVRIVKSRQNEALGIIQDITDRKYLEREVLEISESEKRRIGQDLHDSLSQHLAGVAFTLKGLEKKALSGLTLKPSNIQETVELIDHAITLTRGFARGLNPVSLEADGLISALSELSLQTEKIFGIKCVFYYNDRVLINDNETATHLYRIVQEAVNNAVKHSRADSININLIANQETLRLSVQDNGKGIELKKSGCSGMGLNIMKYRASIMGSSLEIISQPQGGTEVLCLLMKKN